METGLKGRTVIITGASRNIGRRGAELFAEEGCNLAICTSSKMDQLAETAAECEKRGAKVLTMQVDVSDEVPTFTVNVSVVTAVIVRILSLAGSVDLGYG